MQQMFIKFKSAGQVRDFVNMIDRLEGEFDLGSGNRVVDAKSILGVFTLDLTQPQRLCCHTEDPSIQEFLLPFVWKEI